MQLSVSVMEDIHDVRRSIMAYKQFFRAYFVYSTYWMFWESVKRIFFDHFRAKTMTQGLYPGVKSVKCSDKRRAERPDESVYIKSRHWLTLQQRSICMFQEERYFLKKKLCIREFYAEKQRNEPTLR